MTGRNRKPVAVSESTARRISDDGTIESLLTLLEDTDCRAILEATSRATLSAEELADRCDIPLSTTYRKVSRLEAAGLLEEHIRLTEQGRHTNEYQLQTDRIELGISKERGIELVLSRDGESPSDAEGPRRSQTAD